MLPSIRYVFVDADRATTRTLRHGPRAANDQLTPLNARNQVSPTARNMPIAPATNGLYTLGPPSTRCFECERGEVVRE